MPAETYKDWDSQPEVELLHYHTFVSLKDLLGFVRKCENLQFFNPVARDIIRTNYSSLPKNAPFSKNGRFPIDYWVDLDCVSIAPVLSEMIAALELPIQGCEQISSFQWPDIYTAKRRFDAKVNELGQILRSLDSHDLAENGIYCRRTFETRFGLTWGPS